MTNSNDGTQNHVKFPDISPRAYEHPADRAALTALRKVRGFDLVLKQIFGAIPERRLRLLYLANAVRIGPEQLPEIHAALEDVCNILDLEEIPELFLLSDPRVNAMAIGIDSPYIVINSSLISLLAPDELRCVLAHEVGHILSGHALYKTMLVVLQAMMRWLLRGPMILPSLPVLLALKEWDRKSELSADRASLLVTQDVDLARRAMIKLAGGSGREGFNLDEFDRQAEEYQASGGVVDKLFKILNLLEVSHPFPVLRVGEISRFGESDTYASILAGDYPRRSDSDAEDVEVRDDLAEAVDSYRDDIEAGREPLADLLIGAGNFGRSVLSALLGTQPASPEEAPADDEPGDSTDRIV
jgi:Zn-dependent protease with chaperone function